MKKLSIFLMTLLTTAFMGCSNDNYDPAVGPQSYLPESPVQVSDVNVTNTATAINIADFIDENDAETPIPMGTFTVKEGAMPANTIMMAEIEISQTEDFAKSAIVKANSLAKTQDISIQPSDLEDVYFNEISKNPATTDLYIRTIMYTQTKDDAVARIGKPGETYFAASKISLTPLNRVSIAPAYYIVGGPNDWQTSAIKRSIKFSHSDEDVYVDPIFTVTFDAAASGDTWFAIGDDAACDAIAAGDWSQLYGIVGSENEAKSGQLDRRYNLGGDNSFCVKAGAKKIRVTIDMMEQTFQVETVNIADAYYIIGGNGSWSNDKSQKMSHSDKDVFEDPIFSYILTGGSELWFAFGEAEALDATADGDWNQLFGYVGEQGSAGSYERRSVLGAENTFHLDGTAKYYRFTINALNKTYTITPLNFQEYIYEAGCNNSWGEYQQPLYCADGNGTYTGYFYAKDDSWTDGKGAFKFRGAADNWDNGNYGTGTFDEATLTGTLIDDGGSGNIMPAPGFYRADVNLADMSFKLTAINSVYVVGSAVGNDWDNGVAMTFNHDKHCWECDATFTEAGVIKFKGNGTWDSADGNWGGTMDNIINGSNDNIPVTLSGDVHIEFYPLCDTKSYCTITAR